MILVEAGGFEPPSEDSDHISISERSRSMGVRRLTCGTTRWSKA